MFTDITRDGFRQLARKYQQRAQRAPWLYRLTVYYSAVFGFTFFYLLLLLALAFIGFGIWGLVELNFNIYPLLAIVAGGYLLYVVARTVLVRIDPPAGVRLDRSAAPELWATIDDLRKRTGGGRIHKLVIVDELTAGLVQAPRRGLITGYRNYLICGLPLMLTLSEQQMTSVIAHELGHLARRHGAMQTWIVRQQRVWDQILAQFEKKPKHPLAQFARWYSPRLTARSIVLRRQHEHDADGVAAEVTSSLTAGDALVTIQIRERQIGDFWKSVWRRCAVERHVPTDVFSRLRLELTRMPDLVTCQRELASALSRRTQEVDTHPSISERLERSNYFTTRNIDIDALRDKPTLRWAEQILPALPERERSAAEVWFGEALPTIERDVAEYWATGVSEDWDTRHRVLLHDRGDLENLTAELASMVANDATPQTADAGDLPKSRRRDEIHFRRASIIEAIEGETASLTELLDGAPETAHEENYAPRAYMRGRLLLAKHDATGIAFVERAMALDPESISLGFGLLWDYYATHDMPDAADALIRSMDEHDRLLMLARQERNLLSTNDHHTPHEASAADVRRIVCVCRSLRHVQGAYLMKRIVRHFPTATCHVLVVTVRFPWWQWRPSRLKEAIAGDLLQRLRLDTPTFNFVLAEERTNNELLRWINTNRKHHCIYVAGTWTA